MSSRLFLLKEREVSLVAEGLKILSWSLLLALSSYVKFYTPFTPVPFTIQTLVVFAAVIFLKEKALLSEGLWIGMGMIGLPVFTASNMWGPSIGYIIGFLFASLFLVIFLPLKVSFYRYFFLFLFANLIIYISGVWGLIFYLGRNIREAFNLGVVPFWGEDVIKALLASGIIYIKQRKKG